MISLHATLPVKYNHMQNPMGVPVAHRPLSTTVSILMRYSVRVIAPTLTIVVEAGKYRVGVEESDSSLKEILPTSNIAGFMCSW